MGSGQPDEFACHSDSPGTPWGDRGSAGELSELTLRAIFGEVGDLSDDSESFGVARNRYDIKSYRKSKELLSGY